MKFLLKILLWVVDYYLELLFKFRVADLVELMTYDIDAVENVGKEVDGASVEISVPDILATS